MEPVSSRVLSRTSCRRISCGNIQSITLIFYQPPTNNLLQIMTMRHSHTVPLFLLSPLVASVIAIMGCKQEQSKPLDQSAAVAFPNDTILPPDADHALAR